MIQIVDGLKAGSPVFRVNDETQGCLLPSSPGLFSWGRVDGEKNPGIVVAWVAGDLANFFVAARKLGPKSNENAKGEGPRIRSEKPPASNPSTFPKPPLPHGRRKYCS